MNYRKLCASSELKEQMENLLRSEFAPYGIEDIDIEAAIYWFAADNHGGQSSELYSILSTSQYNPSPMEYSPASSSWGENEIVSLMYLALEREFGSGIIDDVSSSSLLGEED